MDQLGIQAVSADTSYSKGVLYRKRDLYRSPLYTAFGGSPKDCSEDVYCTIPDFVKEEIDATVAHSVMPSPMLPTAAQANTRNLLAVSEVCIRFPSAPAIFANTTSNHGILHIHGRLAQASSYSFTMLPSAENRKVGKKVSWYSSEFYAKLNDGSSWLCRHLKDGS